MEKRLLFFIGLLFLTITGCDLINQNGQEEILDPVIVTFNVSEDTLISGKEFTVTVVTENSVATDNNIGAPTTTSWTYKAIANLNMTNVKITAVNVLGRTVTATKNLIVFAPYIPTIMDTLCSKPIIHVADSASTDGGITWKAREIPFGMTKSKMILKKDLTYDGYKYPYGDNNLVEKNGKWTLVEGRKISFAGTNPERFIITDSTLTLFSDNIWTDEFGVDHPLLRKRCFTR